MPQTSNQPKRVYCWVFLPKKIERRPRKEERKWGDKNLSAVKFKRNIVKISGWKFSMHPTKRQLSGHQDAWPTIWPSSLGPASSLRGPSPKGQWSQMAGSRPKDVEDLGRNTGASTPNSGTQAVLRAKKVRWTKKLDWCQEHEQQKWQLELRQWFKIKRKEIPCMYWRRLKDLLNGIFS